LGTPCGGETRDLFIFHFLSFCEKVNADKFNDTLNLLIDFLKPLYFNKKGPSLPMCFVKNTLWQRRASTADTSSEVLTPWPEPL
jgi:hypothetical protein